MQGRKVMWGHAGARLTGIALALSLGACGGDSGPGRCPEGQMGVPPNCTPIIQEEACTQTQVYQDSGPIPGSTLVYDDFSVPDSGRLDVTMDWTIASSQVGFYLVRANACTLDEFNARSCDFLIQSEPSSVKPRKISVTNFNAGNYRWLIGNFGDEQESVAFQIVLSKGPCPALAGLPPVASGRDAEPLPALERALHR